jgi:hypothetical protein
MRAHWLALLPSVAWADGVQVDAGPRALVPVGRLAEDTGVGAGLAARAGWRFDREDFRIVPEGAVTWGLLQDDVAARVLAGGLRLVLDQAPVLFDLHLHVGHGRVAGEGGLSLEAGGALAWTRDDVWSFGAEIAQVQVFTDEGGALGRNDRRFLSVGLVVTYAP